MPADCEIVVTPTGDTGIHSGRGRFRVVCRTCRVVLHHNSTGPEIWADDHRKGRECPYARPMREGEE